ncbi:hypothetical protein GGQ64_003599 [Rhizobium azooxidifex]|jgi:hypothetical protein|uniref:Uncharacterized protein n=1 Tax=Mycoplana azooxidifex TaxID=1636188 RepID=A0A7W6GK83_9HYPH|nr:hypothetical protein [Mycoplana azooxidifex]MBB3978365.1 hypothetical protein [Mycoplana azooxidifex]
MSQNDKADTGRPAVPSADDLRKNILTQQMAEMDREDQIRKRQQEELSKFADDFFHKHVGEEERAIIRNVVIRAVKEGKMEALVYSFPSNFCSDSGRAINNADPDWPSTLQGKAKELFDAFKANAQPKGYHLKAMVINFPGGVPGDIGFYLNWEPPVA